MRHHKHLQLFSIPLVPSVSDTPTLLPSTTIHIQKLNLVIQALGGDVNSGSHEGAVVGAAARNEGFPGKGLSEARGAVPEVGCDGFGNPESEKDEEEQQEGEQEANGEEIGKDEIFDQGSPPWLSGHLRFRI